MKKVTTCIGGGSSNIDIAPPIVGHGAGGGLSPDWDIIDNGFSGG